MSQVQKLRQLLRKLKRIGQIEDGEGKETFEQILDLVKSGKITQNDAVDSLKALLKADEPDEPES